MNTTSDAPPPPAIPAPQGDAADLARADAALLAFNPALGARCPRCGERIDPAIGDKVACKRCAVIPRSAEAGRSVSSGGTVVVELLRGASYLPRGALKIIGNPRLWRHAAVPLLINIILVVVISFFTYNFVNDWLVANTGAGALNHWTGWFWGPMAAAVKMMGWLASWTTLLFTPILTSWLLTGPFSVFTNILFAPFMEILSREAESTHLDKAPPPDQFDLGRIQADLIVAVIDIVLIWFLKISVFVLLFPIALIPIVGTLVWLFIPALFASMDWSDINLVRKRYSTREKVALWRWRIWRFLGFGVAIWLVINIPFINWIVIPSAAVGGTLLYLELDRK